MKVFFCLLLSVYCGLLAALPAVAATNLRFTSIYVDRHPIVQRIFLPWMEEVRTRTNGEVVITYHNPGSLCPESQMYAALRSGEADIVSTLTARTQGVMQLGSAVEVPFLFPSAEAASVAMFRVAHQYPEWLNEFEGMKLLTLYTSALIQVHSARQPVLDPKDLRNQKITATTPFGRDIVRALGAVGMFVPMPDTYGAISRGSADGCFLAFAPLRSLNLHELLKHSFVCNATVAGLFMGMSEKSWNSLTSQQKKIIEETSGEILARKIGRQLDETTGANLQSLVESGLSVVVATDIQREEMRRMTASLVTDWVRSVEERKKTANVRAILDELRDTAARMQTEIAEQ